jgi:GH43 family beta-xylosidase
MNTIKALLTRIVMVGVLMASLLVFTSSATAQSTTFRNPLNNSGPDPFMITHNGNYYLAATTWGGASVGLTMRRASTIAGLKTATAVRIWQDNTSSRCCNYWAPEFHLINGRWYGYFTGGASGTNYTVTQHVHVIESAGTDPMGPYTYKGQLISRAALDASVITINGTMYAIYSVWNARQEVAIKQMSNPWTTTGNEVVIASPTLSWEIQDGTVAEGPVAFQRNGATYIIYSASACWGPNYKLGQLKYTGTNPLSASSWTKRSTPIFQQGNGAFGPGHNSFFKSLDGTEDWIIYHANDQSTDGCDMGRTPRIQKFTVNADGSPNLGTPVSTNTDLVVPSGEGGGTNPTNTPTRTPTRTPTPNGPTLTPTRTPTPGGSPTYQAENAVFGGGVLIESNNAGFNGTGFANFPASGGFVEYRNADGGAGGSKTLQFRFALGATGSRTGQLVVNGVTQNITFNSTGAWTTWSTVNVTVNLNAGTSNTIRLQSNGQDLANLDQLTIN